MTYTDLDRFNDALKGEPKDRVPLFPLASGWAAPNFSDAPLSKLSFDPKLITESQIKAKEAVGYDALFAYSPLALPEAFGCKVRFLDTGPISDPLPVAITGLEDVERLPVPDVRNEGRLPVILEALRQLNAYSGGEIPVFAMFEGAFTATSRIIEPDILMRMIYKNRPVLESLLDRVNAFLQDFGLAVVESGANIIFLAEPTASSSMISPTMFRELVLPRLKILIRKLDVPCLLHICGDTSPILEAMWESGAAFLSLDQCMDLEGARKKVPTAVLGGNVDPINSLLMGTREDVERETIDCLRKAGTSRFILMSGCGVPRDTPVENLKAMIQSAVDYGLGAG